MTGRILNVALIIQAGLSVVSCQAYPLSSPLATPALETPVPVSTSTLELTPSPQPAPTHTVTVSAVAPVCFKPRDLVPFAFMPDNAGLAIRTGSGVQIFNLQTLEEDSFLQAPLPLVSAALSPDGQTLAWSLDDNSIQLVRISDNGVLSTLRGHTDRVYKLRFSPAGDRLFSASHAGWIRIWDMNGQQLGAFQPGGEVLGIGSSPDGKQLATIPFDGPVKLWDLVDNRQIAELGGTGGYDTSDAVFSPDGRFVAADLATGLYLWRISDGKLLWNEVKNSMTAAFSPDGRYLAYTDIDDNNRVVLGSPDGSQVIRTLGATWMPAWELFFSPDGSLLATADGAEIRVWQVEDGRFIYIGKSACP